MRLSDLQSKRIVSIMTGKNIGNIVDIEINDKGYIDYLFVEGNKGVFSLNREGSIKISWNEIEKIGVDVILVK